MKSGLLEAIESNKRKVSFSRKKARAKIEEFLSQPLLPSEQEKVYRELNEFIALDFIYQLSQKYPLISEEIFDLKRQTKKQVEGRYESLNEYILEVPVVVQLPLEESNKGEFSLTVKGKKEKDDDEQEVDVTCSIPEITPEARVAFAEAVKYSAKLTSQAYQDELLSRVLVRDRAHGRNLNGPLSAQYNLVWAPSTWDAKIVERDPAIFMRYANRNLLVHNWQIPKESSLDAILSEFKEDLDFPE